MACFLPRGGERHELSRDEEEWAVPPQLLLLPAPDPRPACSELMLKYMGWGGEQ